MELSRSRIKVYLVEPWATFRKVEELYTLDGRLTSPVTRRGVELLRELWELLGYDEDDDPKSRSPLMCNYELKVGNQQPAPKMYIHLRGENDGQTARALQTFLEKHGCLDQQGSYEEVLRLVS